MQDRIAAESALTAPKGLRSSPGSVVRVARIFAGLPDQVAMARDFVRRVLGPVPVLDDAVLLASELCTNALQHTASGRNGNFVVVVQPRSDSVRVEVRDQGSGQAPTPHPVDVLAEDGRGLSLVDLLADNWGYSGDSRGRSVFFELTWTKPESPEAAQGWSPAASGNLGSHRLSGALRSHANVPIKDLYHI